MTWYSVVKTLLELDIANWVNFGKIPSIIEEGFDNRTHAPDEGLILDEDPTDPIESAKGEVLFEDQSGVITVFSTSRSNRNDMDADIKNIFAGSNIPHEITDIFRFTDEVGKYKSEITVEILSDVEVITVDAGIAGKSIVCPFDVKTAAGVVLFKISCATNIPSNGKVLTWDGPNGYAEWTTNITTDEKVSVSSNDTTPAYLEDKIVATSNKIVLATNDEGANETRGIDVDQTKIDHSSLLNYSINNHFLDRIEQNAEPTLNNNEQAFWWDTDDSKLWLIHRRSGTQYKVELT